MHFLDIVQTRACQKTKTEIKKKQHRKIQSMVDPITRENEIWQIPRIAGSTDCKLHSPRQSEIAISVNCKMQKCQKTQILQTIKTVISNSCTLDKTKSRNRTFHETWNQKTTTVEKIDHPTKAKRTPHQMHRSPSPELL